MKKSIILLAVIFCGLIVTPQVKAAQVNQMPSEVQKLRAVKVTKKSVRLKWKASKNASGYLVFQYDTKRKKYKKIKTTTKKSYTIKKGLKKNKTARFLVQAYRKNGNEKQYAPVSRTISVCLLGSKKKNVKTVNFTQQSLTVEEGAIFRLDPKITPAKKVVSKKVHITSSNPDVAEVLPSGIITTKKKGKVTITAIAHNGVSSKITVWVLEKQYKPTVRKIRTIDDLQLKTWGNDSVKLQWKKCAHADGYIIYRYNFSTKKYTVEKTVEGKKKTSAVISDLKKNTTYSFIAKGYKKKKGIFIYGANSREVSGCVKGSSYENATSIYFPQKEYEVMEDEKLKLDCILQPSNVVSQAVTYSSSKEEIATVSADGTVTGHETGKTYITVYSHNGLSDRIPVRVVDNTKYADRISVLCFHRVVSDNLKKSKFPNYEWVAALSDFERQMKYLYDNQYKTLSLDEFYKWHHNKTKLPAKTVVLTFDDGDYEFYHLVYPILKKYNFKATMFIVGTRTGETTEEYKDVETAYYLGWDKINEMKKEYSGVSFQSHTYNMHYAKKQLAVYELTLAQIYQDFETNRLNGIQNKNMFQYLAYPFGGFNDDIVYCAKKYNYKMAFDFGPGRRATRDDSIYHIPRMKINGQITMDEFKKRL